MRKNKEENNSCLWTFNQEKYEKRCFLPASVLPWMEVAKVLFCILPMSFSRDMALPMFPSIFSLPVMKAVVGFSCPENIFPKSAVLRVNLNQKRVKVWWPFATFFYHIADPWHFGVDPGIHASDYWIRILIRILQFSSLTFKTPTKN